MSAPRDGLLSAGQIAELWAEILEIDDVRPDDSFFEIGGNSLLALDVVAAISSRAGVALPLGEFFAEPTPQLLAAALERRTSGLPR